LGGFSVAGGALKSTATQPTPGGWFTPNTGATNSSGFSAGPGGLRNDDYGGAFTLGAYFIVGNFGYWWSSSLSGPDAWLRYLAYYNGNISRNYSTRTDGFSVRCLRD
jgi:uncharacterized protein (TIGR02145 family)